MSKLTKSFKTGFTLVPNNIINDKTISLKAKGIYLFLVSKPDNWHFSVDRISSQNSDGEASVKSALKELENKRFLKRVQVNKRGIFGENYYIVYDEPYPLDENRLTVPSDENPLADNPSAENQPTLVNTDLVNQERENNITSLLPEIIDDIKYNDPMHVFDKFPHAGDFVCHCLSTTRRVHSPVAFKASIYDALNNPQHKKHDMTVLAYIEFVNQNNHLRSYNSNFPDLGDKIFDFYESGCNVFDIIGRD